MKKIFNYNFNYKTIIYISIILGIMLRLAYFYYTPYDTRHHDVTYPDGHMYYIQDVAGKITLPEKGDGQYYHPPVHYIISGAVYALAKSLKMSDYNALRSVQMLMVFISTLSMIFVYKMLNRMKIKKAVVLFGTIFFAFHPTNIMISSQINNDNTMLFFAVLTFYALISWIEDKSYKNIIFLAISFSFAVLSKKSAAVLAFPVGAAFIVEMLSDLQRNGVIFKYLKQYLVFGIIGVPLSVSHIVRNYIMFGQGFGYILRGGGNPAVLGNGIMDIIGFDAKNFFKILTPDPMGKSTYFEYAFKTSLFGEWGKDFSNIRWISALLIIFALMILVMVIIGIFASPKKQFFKYGYIFLINIVITIIFAIKMRMDMPAGYSQDFRYLSPILISGAFFIGSLISRLRSSRSDTVKKYVKNIAAGILILFCIASSLSILSLAL